MTVVLSIVSVIFGGLSLAAAISQMRDNKKSTPAVLMMIGSAVLISAVICSLAKQPFDFVLAFIGCAAICISAICNGLKSGAFHIQHHIIRITLSLILTAGFVFL